MELEDVGPRVVTDDIEVELAPGDFGKVDVGIKDRLPAEVRSCENLAERVDDRTAAAHHDSVRLISESRLVIGRKGAARDVLACGEDEATALEGDRPPAIYQR